MVRRDKRFTCRIPKILIFCVFFRVKNYSMSEDEPPKYRRFINVIIFTIR